MNSDPHLRPILEQLGWMSRIARRETRDSHAADDALQDALVRALRVRPRATDGPELRSWLRHVVRAVARQGRRSESRRHVRELMAASPPDARACSPDDHAERESTALRVRQALQRVREPYGSALRLRYVEGLSAVEAAVRLEITPEAMRQRTSRGLRLLRAELERRGRTQTVRGCSSALLPILRRRARGRRVAWAAPAAAVLAATLLSQLGEEPAPAPGSPRVASMPAETRANGSAMAFTPAPGPDAAVRTSAATWAAPAGTQAREPDDEHEATAIALELQPGDWFGSSPARLGDLDGDGNPELAIGAPAGGGRSAGEGSVWIVSVDAKDRLVAWNKIVRPARPDGASPQGRELFGYGMTSLGDLDGDGMPELAAGAPWFDSRPGVEDDGGVWLLFLDRAGAVKRACELSARTVPGLAEVMPDDGFGAAITAPGDIDGDGIGDLVVGAHNTNDGGQFRGAVWILFLRTDGTARAARKISATAGGFAGTLQDRGHFGNAVSGLGDVDADGVPDLAVGAPFGDDPPRGALWILFLRRDGRVRWEQRIAPDDLSTGAGVRLKFAARIDQVGDVNGDGRIEIAVGAEGESRIFALERDGRVSASSTERVHGGGVLFLGPAPDDGGALRYLHSNCKANEERGLVKFHRIRVELQPEYPRH